MDIAKQTHVFDITPEHRIEPRLLPSLIIRFGCEREQQRICGKPFVPFLLIFLSLTYCVCIKNDSGYIVCTVCIYNLHTCIYIIYMDFKYVSEL